MSWTTPKTDWVATDFVSDTAYNRWINNLNYLQTLCKKMYALNETNLGSDVTEDDIPFEDMLNAIETALENVNIASYDFNIGEKTVFEANGHYIDYVEINRIESAELKLYKWLTAQYNNIPVLSFRLGQYRGIKV